MLELIDKEAAYIALKREAEAHMLPESHEAYIRAARIIDQMKPIEAEPVRHGRWIPRKPDCRGYTEEFMCSECNAITYMHLCAKDCEYDFCQNCGAEMDGGADN